jgi:hypothetical protein
VRGRGLTGRVQLDRSSLLLRGGPERVQPAVGEDGTGVGRAQCDAHADDVWRREQRGESIGDVECPRIDPRDDPNAVGEPGRDLERVAVVEAHGARGDLDDLVDTGRVHEREEILRRERIHPVVCCHPGMRRALGGSNRWTIVSTTGNTVALSRAGGLEAFAASQRAPTCRASAVTSDCAVAASALSLERTELVQCEREAGQGEPPRRRSDERDAEVLLTRWSDEESGRISCRPRSRAEVRERPAARRARSPTDSGALTVSTSRPDDMRHERFA